MTVASPLLSAQPGGGAYIRRCQHCGKDISGKHASAKVCSAKCHHAANIEKIHAQKSALRAANPEKFRARDIAYGVANAEKIRAASKARYAANREKDLARLKVYRVENRERILSRHRELYAANPEKFRAFSSAHRAANPDKIRARNNAYRARKINANTTTRAERKAIANWIKAVNANRKFKCYWCEKLFPSNGAGAWHIDHIVALAKGGKHASENLCVSCPKCNLSKQDMNFSEWSKHVSSPTLGL